jgi:hypothetical protein
MQPVSNIAPTARYVTLLNIPITSKALAVCLFVPPYERQDSISDLDFRPAQNSNVNTRRPERAQRSKKTLKHLCTLAPEEYNSHIEIKVIAAYMQDAR